ncbi:MAG: nuclear transport factor 2 family protein [Novosphingobium sp.]|jgi:hypothetical protein|nr:nuclear transport factor 2 family protein [Novosphingobium sp.]MCP5379208.1 nuclear transport factor 2 family protein [Novosphingobium sp.]
MADLAQLSDRFFAAYNDQDFDTMAAMLAEQLDFNHFNRDFPMNSRDQLLETLRTFAGQYFVERGFGPPEKLLVDGNTVVRVADYTGIGKVDLPGFGNAGERFTLKLCSILRFNDDGLIVEWKDFG